MTLDATVAGAAADSYLTIAAADALAGSDMGPEADRWLAATTTVFDREKALKRATREIDGFVRTGWPRYSGTQARVFPRSIDQTSSGVAYIPPAILQATYHQAAYILANAAVIDRASARHARDLSSSSEPDTSGTVSGDGMHVMSPRALHFLSSFATAGSAKSGTIRSLRMSSGFPGSPT
jgi:hypothetical protein